MDTYTIEELNEALRAIVSLLNKCEKAQIKFNQGTSQWTLLENRIKALRISYNLLINKINDSN